MSLINASLPNPISALRGAILGDQPEGAGKDRITIAVSQAIQPPPIVKEVVNWGQKVVVPFISQFAPDQKEEAAPFDPMDTMESEDVDPKLVHDQLNAFHTEHGEDPHNLYPDEPNMIFMHEGDSLFTESGEIKLEKLFQQIDYDLHRGYPVYMRMPETGEIRCYDGSIGHRAEEIYADLQKAFSLTPKEARELMLGLHQGALKDIYANFFPVSCERGFRAQSLNSAEINDDTQYPVSIERVDGEIRIQAFTPFKMCRGESIYGKIQACLTTIFNRHDPLCSLSSYTWAVASHNHDSLYGESDTSSEET
ncbi:MAG: hypothetical protein S4CHLAM102_15150 [Chlamydiia bacterium]|nr:hypothetical protein [Chlamydiia bacterium]